MDSWDRFLKILVVASAIAAFMIAMGFICATIISKGEVEMTSLIMNKITVCGAPGVDIDHCISDAITLSAQKKCTVALHKDNMIYMVDHETVQKFVSHIRKAAVTAPGTTVPPGVPPEE